MRGMDATEGSEDPFRELYRQHYPAVLAYVARRVQGGDPADIAAETFLIAWRKVDDALAGGLPWLYRTAAYEIGNERRGQMRRQRLVDRLSGLPEDRRQADHADAYVERAVVLDALRSLAQRDRELILLTEWEELDIRAAALVVGCSTGAARVRLHRARRRLARLLSPAAGGQALSGQGPARPSPREVQT